MTNSAANIQPDLTVAQVAAILQVSPGHVDKLCQAGYLRAYKLSPRPKSEWRIEQRDLEKYKARLRNRQRVRKTLSEILDGEIHSVEKERVDIPAHDQDNKDVKNVKNNLAKAEA